MISGLKSIPRCWGVGLGLCLLLAGLADLGPDAVVTHVLAQRVDSQRSGWRVRFSQPRSPGTAASYRDVIPAHVQNHLPPDYGALIAFGAWEAPKSGYYRWVLALEGRGALAIDGRPVVVLSETGLPEQQGEGWVHLSAGRHVLLVALERQGGGGSFSLALQEPPLMRQRLLHGSEVLHLDTGSLETWWALMTAGHRLAPPALAAGGVCALALLLPLTLLNSRRSVAVLALIILLPALALAPAETEVPYIAPMVHRELRAKSPEFVFIGNSMLWSRIDDAHLTALLGGRPVHSIVNFGALSGIHYLALKYLLIPSGVKPKRTFIFFRSTTLVNPQARTRGPYFDELIRRISPGPDPVFQRIAYGRTFSPKLRIGDWLAQRFPVMRSQAAVRDTLSQGAALLALAPGEAADEAGADALRRTVNQRLGFDNLKSAEGSGLDVEAQGLGDNTRFLDFDARVGESFLPAILKLGSDHGLPLAFIRVQQRPAAAGMPPDSPAMTRFMRSLKAYLSLHGAEFYDFSGDPTLTLEMYALGDHIEDPRAYTEIFHHRLGHLLQ